MTIDQLVVLDAIITQGTFRAAADHLNKAQSAISHSVKKLEVEVGFGILSREQYRPLLTKQGEVFYRHATRVLREMQDLKSIAKNLNSGQEAELLLSVTATYPLPPLLNLIGKMTSEFPATHIRLSRDTMGGPLERLISQDAQIAISTLDGVSLEQVEAKPLAPITIIPVAHPDFAPAQNSNLKTQSEMQTHVQIVVADNSAAHEQSKGLMPGGLRWTVSDFAAKKEILLANMGWGGMPEHLIEEELIQRQLVPLNVEGYAPVQVPHYVLRRRDVAAGIVTQEMWQRLVELE